MRAHLAADRAASHELRRAPPRPGGAARWPDAGESSAPGRAPERELRGRGRLQGARALARRGRHPRPGAGGGGARRDLRQAARAARQRPAPHALDPRRGSGRGLAAPRRRAGSEDDRAEPRAQARLGASAHDADARALGRGRTQDRRWQDRPQLGRGARHSVTRRPGRARRRAGPAPAARERGARAGPRAPRGERPRGAAPPPGGPLPAAPAVLERGAQLSGRADRGAPAPRAGRAHGARSALARGPLAQRRRAAPPRRAATRPRPTDPSLGRAPDGERRAGVLLASPIGDRP